MKTLFIEHKLLMVLILVLFFFSVLCQFLMGFVYQKMIKESYRMSVTNHPSLKQCKLKFSNCYELHDGVQNIPVFVDKFLHDLKLFHIPVKSFYHLSGQLMLLSVFAAGSGSCRGIAAGETIGQVLPYYVLAFILLYAYFSVQGILDIQGKRDVLKINLIDYLENNMSQKIPRTKIEQHTLDLKEEEIPEEKKAANRFILNHNEEKELEGLLAEVLK